MDWIRFINKQQTKLRQSEAGGAFQFTEHYKELASDSYNNTERNHRPKRHRINQYILKLTAITALSTCVPVYATDVGGVSATANPALLLGPVTKLQ